MSDSTLYLYDSLLAETSHTIANLSRIETTLAAYDLPYKVIDVTTDDKALELWNSQSNGRTLPALVKFGRVIGVCPPSSTASPSKEGRFTNSFRTHRAERKSKNGTNTASFGSGFTA